MPACDWFKNCHDNVTLEWVRRRDQSFTSVNEQATLHGIFSLLFFSVTLFKNVQILSFNASICFHVHRIKLRQLDREGKQKRD